MIQVRCDLCDAQIVTGVTSAARNVVLPFAKLAVVSVTVDIAGERLDVCSACARDTALRLVEAIARGPQ